MSQSNTISKRVYDVMLDSYPAAGYGPNCPVYAIDDIAVALENLVNAPIHAASYEAFKVWADYYAAKGKLPASLKKR